MIERSHPPRSEQQWWQATTWHQAGAGFVVTETRGPNQEFAMDHYDRRRAFAVVFLAVFGLLFFVSPAVAWLTTIFRG